MEIGNKLKEARFKSGLTQEKVAEEILVSRQTISNWENEKSYPDIISVIRLSDLYGISLDELLKGDDKMIKYLEESTDVVRSNKKLIILVAINIIFVILMVVFSPLLESNRYILFGVMAIVFLSIASLFYQIIRRF